MGTADSRTSSSSTHQRSFNLTDKEYFGEKARPERNGVFRRARAVLAVHTVIAFDHQEAEKVPNRTVAGTTAEAAAAAEAEEGSGGAVVSRRGLIYLGSANDGGYCVYRWAAVYCEEGELHGSCNH